MMAILGAAGALTQTHHQNTVATRQAPTALHLWSGRMPQRASNVRQTTTTTTTTTTAATTTTTKTTPDYMITAGKHQLTLRV